ncbi:terpenoid synthase [Lentinula novae-zelandiae]|nr:terpenoid synthase [Lentinula novae-zelandiae]
MEHTSDHSTIYIPDTMSNWPWPRMINPHYEEVKAASDAWFHSFAAFDARAQLAFDKCNFEHLRTGCDLMNLFFVIDEYTDVETESVVRQMVDIVSDALNHPHKTRPSGENILGLITQQFWKLAIKTASPTSQHHMVESFTAYLESVVQQAADRDRSHIRTVDSYFETRRENIGARPSYVPMELGLDLPDEVFYHPVILKLSVYIADLIILDNDIASYNKEQANGDDHHNILTVVMHQLDTDLNGAMVWATTYHDEIETKFLDGLKYVPSWGDDLDGQIQQYLTGLANWPRCNDCWNFESGRYFGKNGKEIQRTRKVPLLPKSKRVQ